MSTTAQPTTGTNLPTQQSHQHPCPSCGHCPTCGRGGKPNGGTNWPWRGPYSQPYPNTWITCGPNQGASQSGLSQAGNASVGG